MARNCGNVLKLIFRSAKQFKPAYLRGFMEMLINIDVLSSKYPEMTFDESSNNGFERCMGMVGNMVSRYLQCLDDDLTPHRMLAKFHYIAKNAVVVNNLLKIMESQVSG
eukprot:885704_1